MLRLAVRQHTFYNLLCGEWETLVPHTDTYYYNQHTKNTPYTHPLQVQRGLYTPLQHLLVEVEALVGSVEGIQGRHSTAVAGGASGGGGGNARGSVMSEK